MKSFKEFIAEAIIEEATFEVAYKGSFTTVTAKDEKDAIKKAAKSLKLGMNALDNTKDFKVKKTDEKVTGNSKGGKEYDVKHKNGGTKVTAKDEKDAIKKAAKSLKLGSTALERPQDFKVTELK